MRLPMATTVIVSIVLASAPEPHGQPSKHGMQTITTTDTMPEWLRLEMNQLTRGSGRWIADNRAYQGVNEPWDQFGTEWRWGLGQQTIIGRLYGLIEGREVGTFWEFRLFWHAGDGRAILQQFGADGTYGAGPMVRAENGTFSDQTFHRPDGATWRTGHRSYFTGDTQVTESQDRVADRWEPRRRYDWKRVS